MACFSYRWLKLEYYLPFHAEPSNSVWGQQLSLDRAVHNNPMEHGHKGSNLINVLLLDFKTLGYFLTCKCQLSGTFITCKTQWEYNICSCSKDFSPTSELTKLGGCRITDMKKLGQGLRWQFTCASLACSSSAKIYFPDLYCGAPQERQQNPIHL